MLSLVFSTLKWIKMYVPSERGQDLIEYAMLGGLIALAIAGAALFLQDAIASMGTGIGNCIDFDSSTDCTPF